MGVSIINLLVLIVLGPMCLWADYSSLLQLGGSFSICKTVQNYFYVYPLRGNQDPVPRLHYGFLTALLLSLNLLLSLISNYLNLPFGTPGMSWRLNEACVPIPAQSVSCV